MFCKFCGNNLAEKDINCPKCGAAVTRRGGVGFWDIASAPRDEARNAAEEKSTAIVPKAETKPECVKPEAKKDRLRLPMLVVILVLLVALIFSVKACSSAKTEIREIQEAHLLEKLALDEKLGGQSGEIEEKSGRIAELETENETLRRELESLRAPQSAAEPATEAPAEQGGSETEEAAQPLTEEAPPQMDAAAPVQPPLPLPEEAESAESLLPAPETEGG